LRNYQKKKSNAKKGISRRSALVWDIKGISGGQKRKGKNLDPSGPNILRQGPKKKKEKKGKSGKKGRGGVHSGSLPGGHIIRWEGRKKFPVGDAQSGSVHKL